MKTKIILKICILLGYTSSIVTNHRLDIRDFIDDENELFSRDCKFAMTDNLYAMKNCLSYLEDSSINENDLNILCNSFQDYYAKDSESEDEEDDENEEEKEDDEEEEEIQEEKEDTTNLLLIETKNDTSTETIPIIQMSNITEEEAEVLHEVTKVINRIDDDDNNTINEGNKKPPHSHHEDEDEKEKDDNKQKGKHPHGNGNKNQMCHIYVKKWKEKCQDVSRIASIINTSLEIFYFRRESYCLLNSQHRYCSVVMNEIHQRTFNSTGDRIFPLSDLERNNTCECFKERMTYYLDEYYSSMDPTVEQKRKHYSKSRNTSGKAKISKRFFNEEEEEEKGKEEIIPDKKEKMSTFLSFLQTDYEKEGEGETSSLKNKLRNMVDLMMRQYFPVLGLHHRRPTLFPSFKELRAAALKQNQMINKKEKGREGKEEEEEEEKKYPNTSTSHDQQSKDHASYILRKRNNLSLSIANPLDFYRAVKEVLLEDSDLSSEYIQKRMESDVNVEQLRRLINKYNNEMNQYMDISMCNITFRENNTKNIVNSEASPRLFSYSFLFLTIVISHFLIYFFYL